MLSPGRHCSGATILLSSADTCSPRLTRRSTSDQPALLRSRASASISVKWPKSVLISTVAFGAACRSRSERQNCTSRAP
eukprot:3337301-Prymnesium_polylepis.2